jgi:LysM repeat protein
LYQAQWQGNITAKLLAYSNREEELLTGLELAELDPNVIEGLPGFAIYYVKPNDSLWQIGKKYYVSIERLKSINNITGDEICAGDRILVVK